MILFFSIIQARGDNASPQNQIRGGKRFEIPHMWDTEQPETQRPGERACGLNFAGAGGPKNIACSWRTIPASVHGPGTEISYSVHRGLDLVSSYRIKADGTLTHLSTIDISGKNFPWTSPWTRQPPPVIKWPPLQGESSTPSVGPATAPGAVVAAAFTYGGQGGGRSHHPPVPLGPGAPLSLRLRPGARDGRIQADTRPGVQPGDRGLTETDRFLYAPADDAQACSRPLTNRWVDMCEEKGNKVLYFQFDGNTGLHPAPGALHRARDRHRLPTPAR